MSFTRHFHSLLKYQTVCLCNSIIVHSAMEQCQPHYIGWLRLLYMACLRWGYGWSHSAITTAGITGPELHKSIGILLMMGLVIRVVWRLFSPPPAALASYSRLTRIAAAMGHLALYLLLFSIVISGYLISTADGKAISVFGWFDIPATSPMRVPVPTSPVACTCGLRGPW